MVWGGGIVAEGRGGVVGCRVRGGGSGVRWGGWGEWRGWRVGGWRAGWGRRVGEWWGGVGGVGRDGRRGLWQGEAGVCGGMWLILYGGERAGGR